MNEIITRKSEEFILPEIPPIFKTAQSENSEKVFDNVAFYRIMACVLVLISMIILRIFFPDVFNVIDSWMTEKLALDSLKL
ncbi:MAG: hypothetical protein FWD48_00155 [Oscillospiraceae bacterium]|nr:hypothetical protein [Oscillospiraceae bacterium]